MLTEAVQARLFQGTPPPVLLLLLVNCFPPLPLREELRLIEDWLLFDRLGERLDIKEEEEGGAIAPPLVCLAPTEPGRAVAHTDDDEEPGR
jgi:hypothetical protein